MLFSLLKHHLDLNINDTALKVSRSLYCFTTSISHGVGNYFPRLWGMGISDAIFVFSCWNLKASGNCYRACPMTVTSVSLGTCAAWNFAPVRQDPYLNQVKPGIKLGTANLFSHGLFLNTLLRQAEEEIHQYKTSSNAP